MEIRNGNGKIDPEKLKLALDTWWSLDCVHGKVQHYATVKDDHEARAYNSFADTLGKLSYDLLVELTEEIENERNE